MRSLDRDPRDRQPSAADLARELEDGSEAATRPLGPPVRVRRTRSTRRIWAAAAGAAALVAAVLALSLGGGEDPPVTPAGIEPVPAGGSPADDARNLADWLRANSR